MSLLSTTRKVSANTCTRQIFGNRNGRKHPDDGPIEDDEDEIECSAMKVLALEQRDRERRLEEAEAEEAAADTRVVAEKADCATSQVSSPSGRQTSPVSS